MVDVIKQKKAAGRLESSTKRMKNEKKEPEPNWKQDGQYELWVNHKREFVLIARCLDKIKKVYRGEIAKDLLETTEAALTKKKKETYYVLPDYEKERLLELGYYKLFQCKDDELTAKMQKSRISSLLELAISQNYEMCDEKTQVYIRRTAFMAPYFFINEKKQEEGKEFYEINSLMSELSIINLSEDQNIATAYRKFWECKRLFFAQIEKAAKDPDLFFKQQRVFAH